MDAAEKLAFNYVADAEPGSTSANLEQLQILRQGGGRAAPASGNTYAGLCGLDGAAFGRRLSAMRRWGEEHEAGWRKLGESSGGGKGEMGVGKRRMWRVEGRTEWRSGFE